MMIFSADYIRAVKQMDACVGGERVLKSHKWKARVFDVSPNEFI